MVHALSQATISSHSYLKTIKTVFVLLVLPSLLSAQNMLDPSRWEKVELIPPIEKAFIEKNGIQSITFQVQKKYPNERVSQVGTVEYSYNWDGDLVEKKEYLNQKYIRYRYIHENGLLKITLTEQGHIETRMVNVFNQYGKVIERLFFKRDTNGVVPTKPFKTERVSSNLIEKGRAIDSSVTNHYGKVRYNSKTYLTEEGLPEEKIIRTSGRTTTIYWKYNEKKKVNQIVRKSNYLLSTYDLFYRNNKLDYIEEQTGKKQKKVFFQYEGAIPGALSSILKTNVLNQEMDIIHVEYTTF